MSEEPPNLVLDLLRAIRGDISEMKEDIREIKERLGLLEQSYSNASRRLDRVSGDIETIKRRLDIVDA